MAQVRTYPLKSAGAAELSRAEVTPRGLSGDRTWVVVGADGTPLRARDAPGLRDVVPLADGADLLLVLAGEPAVPAAEAAPALSAHLGRAVSVRHEAAGSPDVAAVHLVSLAALGEGSAAGCADDPRANLYLALDDGPDGDETTWVGRRVRVGDAVLRITRRPKHCLGVYADVLVPGGVAEADPVELLDA